MKKFALALEVLIAVAVTGYVILRIVGLGIATTADAFANPVVERSEAAAELRRIYYLNITPAPWPPEAAWIHRAAKMGIPVKISLQGKTEQLKFTISGVDQNGHLLVYPKDEAEFAALSNALR